MELNGKFQYLSQNWSNPKIRGSICCGFSAAAQNWTTSVFLFCLCKCFLSPLTLSLSFVVDTVFVLFVFCLWHWLCLLCHRLCCVFSAAAQTWAALVCFFPMKMHYSRKMDQFAGSGTEILELNQRCFEVANIGRLNLFWFDMIWDKPQWKTNIIICLWKCPNTSSMANTRRFYLDTSVQ